MKVARMGYSPITFTEKKMKFGSAEKGLVERDVVVMSNWLDKEFGFIHTNGEVDFRIEDEDEWIFEADELEVIVNKAKEFKEKHKGRVDESAA